MVFVRAHIDPPSRELHPFGLEPHPLFQALLTRQGDPSPRRDHPMPRQSLRLPQRPNYLAGSSRISRGLRNRAVGRDLAARNPPDNVAQFVQHVK